MAKNVEIPEIPRFSNEIPEIPKFSEKEKAQALAVVMMCATQSGLVNQLFPDDGDPDMTKFTNVGTKEDFLGKFIGNVKNTHAESVFVHYCEALTTLFATIVQDYSPPYCPGGKNGPVFQNISDVVNHYDN